MKPKRSERFDLRPIGVIRSTLKERSEAPKQGSEGAPDAWIEIEPCFTRLQSYRSWGIVCESSRSKRLMARRWWI